MIKILDSNGLSYFWNKIKSIFATKSELNNRPTAKIYYGECKTAAATNPKVCTVEEFPLDENNEPLIGTIIAVKFTNTNSSTSTSPQLNVNNLGAARIYQSGGVLATAKSTWAGYAGYVIYYMWDGTYWVVISSSVGNSNTTYSVISDSELETGTATTGRLITAARLKNNYNINGRTITIANTSIDIPEDISQDVSDLEQQVSTNTTTLNGITPKVDLLNNFIQSSVGIQNSISNLIKIYPITQTDYDNLTTKNPNILYTIVASYPALQARTIYSDVFTNEIYNDLILDDKYQGCRDLNDIIRVNIANRAFVQDIKHKGHKFDYTGDTLTYDGQTYYIWCDSTEENNYYAFTTTLSYWELFYQSCEADINNRTYIIFGTSDDQFYSNDSQLLLKVEA